MSERFGYDNALEKVYDYDKPIADTFESYGVFECCEIMNEQHEQIQALIQSSKELEEDCQSTFNAMSRKQDDLYRKNFKLKEENKQLKSEINMLKVTIGRNESYIDRLTHQSHWRTSAYE